MGFARVVTSIRAPAAICFDAARDVAVHVQSAAFSRERVVRPGKVEGLLDIGDVVCFEGRHFGIKQTFCTRIVYVERPKRFVDEMTRGTFRRLRHIHDFEERDGITAMTDTLEWKAPLGILGKAADKVFLERHMEWFVREKQDALRKLIEGNALSTNQLRR